MARFYGKIGYGFSVETPPDSGVWEDQIIERGYIGDVIRDTRVMEGVASLNDNIIIHNSISVIADKYANEHFFAIRYVVWDGVPWTVPSVEVRSPRLILSLGEVYNGPKDGTP